MPVGYHRLVRSSLTPAEVSELEQVDALAQRLTDHLELASDEIDLAHVHLAQSGAIQRIAARLLEAELGFAQELPAAAEARLTVQVRPDFVYRLGPDRGILAEVERGGTTTNNHDLKDFWKAHIYPDAHHLFLIVPHSNWKSSGLPRERPFAHVCRRLGNFFGDPRREVDVVSAHIFGYGRLA